MSHSAFELQRRESINALKITYEEYRHIETGARHIHFNSEDNNNAFLVAFKTVPQDSTGVAHILEHTSLCGSKRYPVRDPFFMMTRRSLSTFMNAFTASDWTAYPFATQSRKDFDNLLQVEPIKLHIFKVIHLYLPIFFKYRLVITWVLRLVI